MAKKSDESFNRIPWVRSVVIENPDITVEEVQAKWDKEKLPADLRPTMQVVIQAKASVARRWGVSAVAELPRNQRGKINKSAMIRYYLDTFGMDSKESAAKEYFEEDGLTLSTGQFSNAKTLHQRRDGSGELDPNQHTGPRARRISKKGRKPGRKGRRKPKQENEEAVDEKATFEHMERQLERLMTKVGRRQNLRDALRRARRLVSAELVTME